MPVGTLVCRQDPDLPSCHLLLVYGHSLADVVNLTFHLSDLGTLEVKHLQEVVGEGVDLVSHAGQTLGRVALGLLQSRPLVVTLRRKEINSPSNDSQIVVNGDRSQFNTMLTWK